MRRDELLKPLRKRSLAERLWARRPSPLALAYAATIFCMVGGSFWATRQPLPFAGEPVVVVAVPPVEEITTASTTPPEDDAADGQLAAAEQADAPVGEEFIGDSRQDSVIIEGAVDQDTYQQEASLVVSPRRPLTPSPVPSITETSAWGPLPKISRQGDTAAKIYARKTSLSVIHSDAPKIALLLGGMGLNRTLTQKAIKELPSDVTLAFAPYGNDLQAQVDKARNEGHEVFLQVPMEPIGFPANNPGPKTLVGDAPDAENLDALRWHMSRFTGYAGVVNYQGSRFLSIPKALRPVFGEVKDRGLYFLEDGSMALSSTESTASITKAKVQRAKVVIDADPSPEAIISALTLLEEQATGTGLAIGTGSGLEVTIDTVREWAKAAAERGIVLVPISASFKGRTG
jgi:polysaccharide deacetylase 2 family uncharacterized protein YibQ